MPELPERRNAELVGGELRARRFDRASPCCIEAFLWLLRDRFGSEGLYVLDEPEAALSPKRQIAMLARIDALVRAGNQLVIATHSPILMAYPHGRIYLLDETGMRTTTYEETEHYQVTRDFLVQRESFLRHLVESD